MKKIIVSILLVVTLANSAFALAPLAVPLALSTAAHVLAIAAYAWKWYNKNNNPASISGDTVKVPRGVQWVDLKAYPGSVGIGEGEGSIDAPLTDVQNEAINGDKYPGLKTAMMQNQDIAPWLEMTIGAKVNIPGQGWKVITNKTLSTVDLANTPANLPTWGPTAGNWPFNLVNNRYKSQYNFYYAPTTPPPPVPKTATQIKTDGQLTDPTTGEIKPEYKPELEEMITELPSIWDYSDPVGAPSSPPDSGTLKDAWDGSTSGNAPATSSTPGYGGSGGSGGSSSGNTGGDPGYIPTPTPAPAPPTSDPDDKPENYPLSSIPKYGDNRPNDVSARVKQFFADMQRSPMFTFASRAAGDIPITGAPTISFDGGVFGVHTYNYASLDSVFLFFYKIFHILAVFSGVKIITKSGDSA